MKELPHEDVRTLEDCQRFSGCVHDCSPGLADRCPTQDEAKAIAAKLTAEGFKSWEEIELDNDGPHWEIDDARHMDGKKYDLKLIPTGQGIIKKTQKKYLA